MDLQETGFENLNLIKLAQDRAHNGLMWTWGWPFGFH